MRATLMRDAPGGPASSSGAETEELDRPESVRLYLELRARGVNPGPPLGAAWEQFYRAEEPRLLRLARAYLPSGADPQDGAQVIWQALVTRLPDFHFDPTQGSIHAWLLTVARHVLIDQRRREHGHPTASLGPEEADQLPGPAADPELACQVHQVQELVRRALAELQSQASDTSYQVLHQHWIEGRCFGAIARNLGLTPKQVRDRHDRMLRQLRPILLRQTLGRSLEQ